MCNSYRKIGLAIGLYKRRRSTRQKTSHIKMYKYMYSILCSSFHSSAQAGQQVLEEDSAQLWWAGKELDRAKLLRDFIGRNEKTKIVAKLQKKGQGAPAREPVVSTQEQKAMMAFAHKKQEEMKVGLRVG